MKTYYWWTWIVCCIAGAALMSGCGSSDTPAVDEAKAAGKTVADYPTHPGNNFKEMDGGVELTEDEIKGRNTWLMWTAGNEAFWDYLAQHSLGLVDLLKLLDNRFHPREERFAIMGLINEPGFTKPEDPNEHGLWLDSQVTPSPGPQPDPAVYGYSSGVMGLRIYPNPNFDEKARRNWDPERYINDENYYKNPDLIRPYRVGMACGFCHVAYHPLYPPKDFANPEWQNLSSNIGNQYFRVSRIFGYDMKESSLIWQLLNSARPGALDTSLIAKIGRAHV